MKTILISTDFSDNATRAAEFGYKLAKQIKANVILSNAFVVPVEMPEASIAVWPVYEYDEIIESCDKDVKALQKHLERNSNDDFRPDIKCINAAGALQDVIDQLVKDERADLIVMGAHGSTGLSGVILGNHCRKMIDNATVPLLLVPPQTENRPIRKIAFASDFENVLDDFHHIYNLISVARRLNAEILLTYVNHEKYHSKEFEKHLEGVLVELSNKADYPKIYYRQVKAVSVEEGLEWLCEHGQVDMLAMVHRPHNLLDYLLAGSHTQKVAARIPVPLMVFPGKTWD